VYALHGSACASEPESAYVYGPTVILLKLWYLCALTTPQIPVLEYDTVSVYYHTLAGHLPNRARWRKLELSLWMSSVWSSYFTDAAIQGRTQPE